MKDQTTSAISDWKTAVPVDTGAFNNYGRKCLVVLGIVFVLWAFLFPISSAVLAPGTVVASGANQQVQHPSGGFVKRVAAQDGTNLKKGDLILVVEPSDAVSNLAQLEARRASLQARKWRLEALGNGDNNIQEIGPSIASGGLRGSSSPTQDPIFDEQINQLKATALRNESDVAAAKAEIERLQSELEGTRNQLANSEQRLAFLNDQTARLRPLAANGFIAKPRLWDLEGQTLDTEGRLSQLEATKESLEHSILEATSRLSALEATQQETSARELAELLEELASIDQRVAAARKELEFTELRAALSGTLTNLTVRNEGAVVRAGEVLAEIVPSDQDLIVEAQVAPQDIETLEIEQPAKVTITAFNNRLTDPLQGQVSYVSADTVIDEATQAPFFTVRIKLDEGQDSISSIKSGMQAEVAIQTGGNTFVSYVLAPITDSFRRAFRER